MIEEGDKVMVCMSGGRDSYALLDILLAQWRARSIHFDLVAVNLDQKQPGFPEHAARLLEEHPGVPFHIENEDTYSIVKRSFEGDGPAARVSARAAAASVLRG